MIGSDRMYVWRRENVKTAVMYGAGNIGRGFIAELFAGSGYEVVFLDINDLLIDTLNKDRYYTITKVSNEEEQQVVIEYIRAINTARDERSAILEIAHCDIMATAVGANILRHIAPVIAKGLIMRKAAGLGDLNILLCENLMDVNVFFRNLLKMELGEASAELLAHVGLVETSIGRMVPVMTGDHYPTDVTVEAFEILHADKDGFVGVIPDIKKMVAYSPFEAYFRRKLFMHNMGHAVTAFLGAIKGYEYIFEAINDVEIRYCVHECGMESAAAIAADGFPLAQLVDFYERLIYRFGNERLRDTTFRVGRDTPRKLAHNDRITGSINLCKKTGVPFAFLWIGVAAGLLFNPSEDSQSKKISEDAARDLRGAITKATGITAEVDMVAIGKLYNLLRNKDIRGAISYCTKLKSSMIIDS